MAPSIYTADKIRIRAIKAGLLIKFNKDFFEKLFPVKLIP